MYWFIDVYLPIIDWLSHQIVIILFKLVRILLETILLMVIQLQYRCCKIRNVIKCWILWNYSLIWMNIVTVYHTAGIFDIVGYIYIILIIVDAINSNCIDKLPINSSAGYNLDQNSIVGYTLNQNSTIMFVIVNYYKFVSNVHKMDQFRQIINKVHNLQYNGYVGVILSLVDALPSITCQKLNTNGAGYELYRNIIIQYTSIKSITTMLISIQSDKFCTNVYKRNQFNQIGNVMHNFDLNISIINVIDINAHLQILVVVYVIRYGASLFIFAYDTFILVFKFIINHLIITYLSIFYLTAGDMDTDTVIKSIINAIIKIILQTDEMIQFWL